MADPLSIGIIGTGGIAGRHARVLVDRSDAVVGALADPDADRTDAFRRRFPELSECSAYDDHQQMIAGEQLDGVVISSPHNVHHPQILDCLRAGLHVLTEKPMVCTTEEAEEVMQAEEEADRILAIAYQRHAQGEFRFIRKQLQSGRAGEVQFINAFQGQNWMKGTTGTWRQMPEISCGGQLNDSGSHLIDIILWVTGLRAKRVNAAIEQFDRQVDINSAVTVEFANGGVAGISVVGNCPVWWEDITIVCSSWTFFMRQGELSYSTGGGGEMLKLLSARYGAESTTANFLESIRGEAEPYAPSVCGLRTIELTEAAWKSAASGESVWL
ncbi:MAG: Gfo/Idh/MocA family oxidoreductase [Candidatus Brocadiia bacterium]